MNNRKPLGQTEYIQPKSPLGRYQEKDGERFPLGVTENTLSSIFPVFHLALKEQDQLESSSWNKNFWYDFEPSATTDQNDSGPSSTTDEIPNRLATNPISEKSESTTSSDIQAFTQQLNPNGGAVVSETSSNAPSLDISQVTENVNNLSPSQPQIQAQASLTAEIGKTPVPEPPIADNAPVLTPQGSPIQLAHILEPNTEAFDEAIASQPLVREPDTASTPDISEPPVQPVQAEQITELNLSSENHFSSTDSNVSSEESSTIQSIKDNLLTSDPTDLLSSTNTQLTAEARESSTGQIIEATQLNANTVQSLPSEAYNLANTEINLTPDKRDEVNLSENIQLKANISLAPNPEVLTSQPSEKPEVNQSIAKPSLRSSKLSGHEQDLNEKVDSAETPEVQLRNIISSDALSPELSSPAPPNHHLENQMISQSFESPNRNILGVPDSSSDLLAKPLDKSTELIPISNAPSEPQAVHSLTPLAGILDLPQSEAAIELTTKNIHRIDCEEDNVIAETTSIQEQSPTKLTLNNLLQTMEKSDRTVTNTPVADIQSSDAASSQGLSEQNLDEDLLEQLALTIPEIDSSRKFAKTYESIFEERSEDNSASDSEADLPLLVKLKQFSELKTLAHPPLIPAFLESTMKPTDGGLSNSNFNRDNSPATSDRPDVLNNPNNATDQPEEFPESWSSLDELVKGSSKDTTANSWQEMIASLTSLQLNSTEDKDKFPDSDTPDPETLEEQLLSSDPFTTLTSVINQKHSLSTTIEPLSTKLSSLTEALTSNARQKVTDEDLERIAQVVYPWIQQQLIYEQERLLGQGSDFPLWSRIIPNMQAKSPLQSRDSPKIIEPQILMDAKLASLSNEIYALLRSRLALERERIGQNHHRN